MDTMLRPSSLDLQRMFLSLPSPVRRAVAAGQSLKNRLTRYGNEYERTRSVLARADHWTTDRLRRYQSDQLLQLLRESKDATEHYREALAPFSTSDLGEIAENLDLASLPLLEKRVLKAETARFFNQGRPTFTTSSTSGSTGSPLVVEYDRKSVEQRFAFLHRLRAWGGVGPFERNVRLSGRQLAPLDEAERAPWLTSPFEGMLLVSTYHLRPPYLARIVERVRRFRPALVDGYPTAIEQFARYCSDEHVTLPGLRMAITTAETLSQSGRAAIEAGLGVRVHDYYGASEGVPFICQCEVGGYHVWSDSGIFEFLKEDGRPVGAGEAGEIVVTSFCQWKTPLVRYRTGDLAMMPASDEPCSCGRTFPLVGGILGRVEDLVKTRDGRSIGMFAYRTLKHVPGMKEAQIVQTGFAAFLVRVVPDGTRSLGDVHRDIERIFESVVGYAVTVEIEVVPGIPRGPNGKFRSVVRAFTGAAPPVGESVA